jgi:predicted dehydrogenase
LNRLAVIGGGVIGSKHAELISNYQGTELVGISDIDKRVNAIAQQYKVAFYNELEELLLAQRPDGVIIAVPNSQHQAVARLCAKYKVHMLIEKPIADSIESAEQITEIVESERVHVLIGHHRRHSSLVKKTKDLINDNDFGKLIGVSMLWALYKPEGYFGVDWKRKKPGGGPLLINLIHELDLLRHLCGEIVEVYAKASSTTRQFEVEDSIVISLEFANGALGNIFASDSSPSPWSYESTTHENKYYYPVDENCYYFLGSKQSLTFPKMELWNYESKESSGWQYPIHKSTKVPEDVDPLVEQLKHFCDVIKGDALPYVSCRDAKKSLTVVLSIIESIEKRLPVNIENI